MKLNKRVTFITIPWPAPQSSEDTRQAPAFTSSRGRDLIKRDYCGAAGFFGGGGAAAALLQGSQCDDRPSAGIAGSSDGQRWQAFKPAPVRPPLQGPPRDAFVGSANACGSACKSSFYSSMKFRLNSALPTVWPELFFFCCLAAYAAPVCASLRLLQDASARFWFGTLVTYGAPVAPFFVIVGYILHSTCQGRLGLLPLLMAALVPAMLLLACAGVHLNGLDTLAILLRSPDCAALDRKQDVHHAWKVAAELYLECVDRSVAVLGLGPADGLRALRLQDCLEYTTAEAASFPTPMASHHDSWEYLGSLEEEYSCGGWCIPFDRGLSPFAAAGPCALGASGWWCRSSLWTRNDTQDVCSVAAAAALRNKVGPTARHMLVGTSIGLGALLALLALGASDVKVDAQPLSASDR